MDYSLFKTIIRRVLTDLQPFKVQVQSQAKGSIIKTMHVGIDAEDPQLQRPVGGKQWRILSGVIRHESGALATWFQCTCDNASIGSREYFTAKIAAATASDDYPLDLVSSEVILNHDDYAALFTGNAGAKVIFRVLETDVT